MTYLIIIKVVKSIKCSVICSYIFCRPWSLRQLIDVFERKKHASSFISPKKNQHVYLFVVVSSFAMPHQIIQMSARCEPSCPLNHQDTQTKDDWWVLWTLLSLNVTCRVWATEPLRSDCWCEGYFAPLSVQKTTTTIKNLLWICVALPRANKNP